MGAKFCVEVSESNNDEDPEEWLRESGASSYITYTKNNLTNIEECNIDVTVVNGQKMKCDIKGKVHMKLQGGETLKFNDVLYVPQEVKNIISMSRLVLKGATMWATKDKITIKKIGVNIIVYKIKVKIIAQCST